MLYFQVVILAGTVMLVYYCEFTDTFSPAQQGFICRDPALTKPDPGPEQDSLIQPVILYSVVGGLPVVLISGVELVIFLLHYNSNNLYDQDKVVVMGDCCYVNPMVRRTFRFLGVYVFGLFATDIFVNAGQLVTGSLAPYFLSVCQPNYTALSCQDTMHFVSQSDACTGDPDDIMRARKTFPSKEAALSLYTAVYLAMYVMSCIGSSGGRLTGPLFSLSLVSLAVLTGINRVAEYRNHWSDIIAGQVIGGAIAVFLISPSAEKPCGIHNGLGGSLICSLVVWWPFNMSEAQLVAFVVQYFKKRPGIPQSPSDAGTANTDEASLQMNHTVETSNKYIAPQSPGSFTEVT